MSTFIFPKAQDGFLKTFKKGEFLKLYLTDSSEYFGEVIKNHFGKMLLKSVAESPLPEITVSEKSELDNTLSLNEVELIEII